MAKFTFRLQNILSVKEKLENQAKAEYGVEMAKLREEQEKKMQMEQKSLQMQEELTDLLNATLDILRIRKMEWGIEMLKEDIAMQEQVIKRQEQQVKKARKKLDQAMQERKTYEKLKEKAFETFKVELNAAEQKEVDELVSFTHSNTTESED